MEHIIKVILHTQYLVLHPLIFCFDISGKLILHHSLTLTHMTSCYLISPSPICFSRLIRNLVTEDIFNFADFSIVKDMLPDSEFRL